MSRESEFLREIKGEEAKQWKPQKQSLALGVIENFISSKMEMAEVNLDALPKPEPKKDSTEGSSKQDSFASSFYAWKKKQATKERLSNMGIDVLLIRRGQKVALKKVNRKK